MSAIPDIEAYMRALISMLYGEFGERLLYVGLQGSYLRGEADGNSDIDIMTVLEDLSPGDLSKYKNIIARTENREKACGFISGRREIAAWNPCEICHLLNTTKDYFGTLIKLIPAYADADVRNFVKISAGNLYHEICHRYIYSPDEKDAAKLPASYKNVFYILQNLYYLKTGIFANTKKELLPLLGGKDREVLLMSSALKGKTDFDFEAAFGLLLEWCGETIAAV